MRKLATVGLVSRAGLRQGLNSASRVSDIRRVRTKANRAFIMTVLAADGTTHRYYTKARSLRHARREAHAWVAEAEWCADLVDVGPVHESSRGRLLVVAATTFGVSGIVIIVAMIIGLSLEGAL